MSGAGGGTCLAPLPYTLFKTHHVVFRHISLRCDRLVLKHRSMVTFEEGPRPLEEGARAARGGTRHVLGRSVLHRVRRACRSRLRRRCEYAPPCDGRVALEAREECAVAKGYATSTDKEQVRIMPTTCGVTWLWVILSAAGRSPEASVGLAVGCRVGHLVVDP